jgi:hypothetical protein
MGLILVLVLEDESVRVGSTMGLISAEGFCGCNTSWLMLHGKNTCKKKRPYVWAGTQSAEV